jgi:D-methionine transport system substrate-binding protein
MKKLLTLSIAIILSLGVFAGCSSTATTGSDKKVIKVGATPVPHEEILEQIKPILAAKGYTLEIVEFTDYVTPNTALADGELDANFFQHIPYLEEFNKEKNLDLTYTVKVHIEPMGVYSHKVKALTELADGATIAIPNDPTNGARALRVLENAGLIKVKEGDLVSKLDITENPKNLVIEELEAAMLPRQLDNIDAAVINANYALEAGLNPVSNALALESADSPYANVLAVKATDKDKPYIKALSEALNSPEVKKFIVEKYNGSVIPAF